MSEHELKHQLCKVVDDKTRSYDYLGPAESILKLPAPVLGSVHTMDELNKKWVWIFDDVKQKIIQSKEAYNAGFLQSFDELIVNVPDNRQRHGDTTQLKVKVHDLSLIHI